MTGYVVRRLVASIVLLLGVTFVTFVLFFKIPEHPEYMLVGPPHPYGTKEQDLRYQRALVAAAHQLGTDQPLYVQYMRYVDRLSHGSLGTSFSQRPVKDLLVPAAKVTFWLVFGGIVLLLLIAVPLGVIAGLNAGRFIDRAILAITLIGVSIPTFLIAYELYTWLEPKIGLTETVVVFGAKGQAPVSGYCPLFGSGGNCSGVTEWAKHLIFPWIAFALGLIGLYVRMVRAGLLELVDEPFVQVARAKGASETRVLRVHVLRNLWPSLATMVSMDIGLALGIALFVEVAFGLQGLGLATYGALLDPGLVAYDLPIIAGVVVIAATVVVILNLIVDVGVAMMDPRIRLVRGAGGS